MYSALSSGHMPAWVPASRMALTIGAAFSGSNLPCVSGWMMAVTCTGQSVSVSAGRLPPFRLMWSRKMRWAMRLTVFFRWYGVTHVRLRRFWVHQMCLLIGMSISIIRIRAPSPRRLLECRRLRRRLLRRWAVPMGRWLEPAGRRSAPWLRRTRLRCIRPPAGGPADG